MFRIRVLKLSGRIQLNERGTFEEDKMEQKENDENSVSDKEGEEEKKMNVTVQPDEKQDQSAMKMIDKSVSKEEPEIKKDSSQSRKKSEIEQNDYDLGEEYIISIKNNKAEPEKTPREPHPETDRELLENSKDNSQVVPLLPLEEAGANKSLGIHTIQELPEAEDQNSPFNKGILKRQGKLDLPELIMANKKEKIDLLGPLTQIKEEDNHVESPKQEFLLNPSTMGDNEQSPCNPVRKAKIIDATDHETRSQLFFEKEDEGANEISVRKHFLNIQSKEKRDQQKVVEISSAQGEDSEEKKELISPKEDLEEEEKLEEINKREQDGEGSVGSTSTGSGIKRSYCLRAAIDEKFIPKSIRNMNYTTIFMFSLILSLAIAYYIFELSLYSSIQNNIQNIGYSEDRKSALFDINLRIKSLILINMDNQASTPSNRILTLNNAEKLQLQQESQANLSISAVDLNDAQTQLSLKTSGMGSSELQKLNPDNVVLNYFQDSSNIPSAYSYTIWQAMMEIVVASFKVSSMTINNINGMDPSVYLISRNSLNSVLEALNISTTELINSIEDSTSNNMQVFLILLIVASAAITVSVIVLIPVINHAKKSKEEVFQLFFLIDNNDIKKYQRKCERFKRENKIVNYLFYFI